MNQYIQEVERILSSFPQRTSTHNPETYIGGGQSRLRYLGLRAHHLKQAMRNGFSFSHRDLDQLVKIWDQIWMKSDCFEVMSIPLTWFYAPEQTPILNTHWPILKKWSSRIENWAHSDTLSGVYARILENDPNVIYPTLIKWNSSRSPWLRRLSIVSLIYYSSHRRKVLPLKKILNLVQPQLEFDHYYVQKGVGWTLREAYNVYPEKTFTFVENNVGKISAYAFSAASEKMTPQEKKHLKRLRKFERSAHKARRLTL